MNPTGAYNKIYVDIYIYKNTYTYIVSYHDISYNRG